MRKEPEGEAAQAKKFGVKGRRPIIKGDFRGERREQESHLWERKGGEGWGKRMGGTMIDKGRKLTRESNKN